MFTPTGYSQDSYQDQGTYCCFSLSPSSHSPFSILPSLSPLSSTPKQGLSEIKVEKIKDAANKILPQTFITGAEAAVKREMVVNITTGSRQFDGMLGGGIQSQSVTEGEFSSHCRDGRGIAGMNVPMGETRELTLRRLSFARST